MSAIVEAWIAAAEEEWARGVDATTPAGEKIIEGYFDVIRWRWAIERAGGRYTEAARRSHPATLEYCGIFWAAMGLRVGTYVPTPLSPDLQIHPRVAEYVLPSTYRLEHSGHWGAVPEADRVTIDEMRRGDIITVATSGRRDFGDHYAGVLSVDRDRRIVETLEANASGTLGDGRQGRGVIKRERSFDAIRRIRRFGKAQLIA
jgi:hypothetical protein